MRSSVEVFDVATGEARVVWQTERLVEAPNWSPDGKFLIINGDGRLYRLRFDGSEPVAIDTGFARECNNDHGISPDGSTLAISDKTEFGKSAIYLLPLGGGRTKARHKQSSILLARLVARRPDTDLLRHPGPGF